MTRAIYLKGKSQAECHPEGEKGCWVTEGSECRHEKERKRERLINFPRESGLDHVYSVSLRISHTGSLNKTRSVSLCHKPQIHYLLLANGVGNLICLHRTGFAAFGQQEGEGGMGETSSLLKASVPKGPSGSAQAPLNGSRPGYSQARPAPCGRGTGLGEDWLSSLDWISGTLWLHFCTLAPLLPSELIPALSDVFSCGQLTDPCPFHSCSCQ